MRPMSDADANLALAKNLASAMSAYARWRSGAEALTTPDFTLVNSRLKHAVFNAAVLTSSVVSRAQLEAAFEESARYYERQNLPWSCWVAEELLPLRVRGVFYEEMEQRQMYLLAEHQGMVADSLLSAGAPPPELTIRPVGSAASRLDFANLCVCVFGMPSTVAMQVYTRAAFWAGGFRAWVGYVNGTAVATAAAEAAAGVVGIYSVATLAAYQRRGYATALTLRALAETAAASGFRRSILQATAAGLPLYRKLGYQKLTRVLVYGTR
jgi:ribosomal protein S18 acetylase RimI-like enzyme